MVRFLQAEAVKKAIIEPATTIGIDLEKLLLEMGNKNVFEDRIPFYRRLSELLLQLAANMEELYFWGNNKPLDIKKASFERSVKYILNSGEYVLILGPKEGLMALVEYKHGTTMISNNVDERSTIPFDEESFIRFSQRVIGFWILDLLDYLEIGGGAKFDGKYVKWDIQFLRSLVESIVKSNFETTLSNYLREDNQKKVINNMELKGEIGKAFLYSVPLIIAGNNNGKEKKKYVRVGLGYTAKVNDTVKVIPNLSELLLYTLGIIYHSNISSGARNLEDKSRISNYKHLDQVVTAFEILLKERILFDDPIIAKPLALIFHSYIRDAISLKYNGIFNYSRVIEKIVK